MPEEQECKEMGYFTKLWRVNLNDFGRGLVIVVLTSVLTVIYSAVSQTPPSFNIAWGNVFGSSVAAGIAYILKNMATGPSGKMLKKE